MTIGPLDNYTPSHSSLSSPNSKASDTTHNYKGKEPDQSLPESSGIQYKKKKEEKEEDSAETIERKDTEATEQLNMMLPELSEYTATTTSAYIMNDTQTVHMSNTGIAAPLVEQNLKQEQGRLPVTDKKSVYSDSDSDNGDYCSNSSKESSGIHKRNYSEYMSGHSNSELSKILSLRKYPAFGGKCYRHSTHVYLTECDKTNRQLQETLNALPGNERDKISNIWSSFASEPAERRLLILQGIVNICCIPQLSYLNKVVPTQLRVDFLAAAPPDISLKILSYLDAQSLCQAAQVSRTWAALANDDILWHRMCAQHIDKVCKKCGWGLPLLDKSSRRVYEAKTRRAIRLAASAASGSDHTTQTRNKMPRINGNNSIDSSAPINDYTFSLPSNNVAMENSLSHNSYMHTQSHPQQTIPVSSLVNSVDIDVPLVSSVCAPQNTVEFMQQDHAQRSRNMQLPALTGSVYLNKRATEESGNASDSSDNSTGQCTRGGYSYLSGRRTKRRPWKDIFAERQIIANNWRRFRYHEQRIQAHADGILCTQFNDEYLITGSYDSKVRVWDTETLEMICELNGHTMPVRALEFDECKLFSGSLDGTVRIWNYRDGTCIRTLRVFDAGGVISLHYSGGTLVVGGENGTIRVYNIAKMTSFTLSEHTDWVNSVKLYGDNTLFSCSDDMFIKQWDLEQRRCVRTFTGHSHHVQSLQLSSLSATGANSGNNNKLQESSPYIISGSLDSTMRVWDMKSGECLDTIFGHTEGIWSMAFDSLRIVSGSNDGSIKIWDTTSHACLYTLHASNAAINCVAISDTRVIIGDNDGNIRVFDFRDHMH